MTAPLSVPVPSDLEAQHPLDIIRWAIDTHGVEQVVATVSFEDAVLAHLVHTAHPDADIVLLDTQYRFGMQVRVVRPLDDVVPDNRWQHDVEGCCQVRKVEPLQRAIAGKAAWITGVRRVDGPTRANAPVAGFDVGRNLVKVNPLATWDDDAMALYAELNDLPANPLSERGYPSIGCWPCTRPVAPGEDKRGGRWAGNAKTECGLHV